MDYTLELIVVPVTDIDRAKAFYRGGARRAGRPGRRGRRDLPLRGAGQTPGLDPERRSYATFMPFQDPDGNTGSSRK